MQDLFAAKLTVPTGDLDATMDAIAAEACGWAWRGDGAPPSPLTESHGQRVGTAGYELTWGSLRAPEGVERAVEVILTHPDESTAGLRWRSAVDVCRHESQVAVTVRVSREATELLIAPAPAVVRRPGLIPSILRAFPCVAGGLAVSVAPSVVHVDGVREFVTGVLRRSDRVLPVVVMSPAPGSTRLPVDPTRLANELAGLAHVVVLGGYLAWDRFREVVGHAVTVPPGGVRLYWPGFGTTGDELRHRFWTRARIAEETMPLHRIIAGLLARVSVHAVPLDPLPRELRRRTAEMQRRAAAESENLDELVKLLQEENTELTDENDAQRAELSQLRDEIASLQRDLEAQRQAWATVQEYGDVGTPPEIEDEAAFSPTSWPEFVDYLDALESPAFVVTERAREMCEQGSYPDPPRMWHHLERLAEAAEAWAAADCSIGGRLDEWIHENYGIEVALHSGSLGNAASFIYEGAEYSSEPHVKVDDYVDPASCGRIYFAYDTPGKRFIVDHIGLHL